jgi:hypothetical protein
MHGAGALFNFVDWMAVLFDSGWAVGVSQLAGQLQVYRALE